LKRVAGCLGSRMHHSDWRFVFQGAPEEVNARLEQSLGSDGIRCERMNLEDFFVELLGGKQGEDLS